MNRPDFNVYAEQLTQLARWAYCHGWAPGTSTNYSVRLPVDSAPAFCAITSSGADKESITPAHIVAVDEDGQPVDGSGLKPSAETRLHLMLYKTAGAGAVLHTHSPSAAILSRLAEQQNHLVLSGWELLKGLEGITTHEAKVTVPIFPNSQDMDALAHRIEPSLRHDKPLYGFLLAGHGLYVWGSDLRQAKRHLEVYEFVLQCEREVSGHGHASGSR